MHSWHHYVAIGDNFTEGIGDPVDGFSKLGAIDRLAAALRQSNLELRYTNLANRGLLVAEIREQQLEAALQLKPDFVSVVAGANDIMTGQFNITQWEQDLRIMYEALTQIGAVVSTGNVPNFPVLQTHRDPLQTPIIRNVAKGNDIIQHLSVQYQVILVDAWAISSQYQTED